ncbi:MAG: hypothetical protein DWQ07_19085 [Chloroflexi bacterium]|nr:MAG: hypothetical protein DWQ07_19085 [Chloroflexota bacterium]MBL1195038.1 hypothetical protein [Chloroflexota bacterium]NOH12327.1 hypothetical protein [Chloroflexota bacterium]
MTPPRPTNAWVISSRTGSVAPVVNVDGTPYGLITGWSLFSFLGETVGPLHIHAQDLFAEFCGVPTFLGFRSVAGGAVLALVALAAYFRFGISDIFSSPDYLISSSFTTPKYSGCFLRRGTIK